jgi:hypothetical protein
MNEREILIKLITTGHINMPERHQLPGGKAKASILIEIIVEQLNIHDNYPSGLKLSDDFSGALIIKKTENQFIVYLKAEISLYRFGLVKEENYSDKLKAAEAYLKLSYPEYQIDGVPIDWTIPLNRGFSN